MSKSEEMIRVIDLRDHIKRALRVEEESMLVHRNQMSELEFYSYHRAMEDLELAIKELSIQAKEVKTKSKKD